MAAPRQIIIKKKTGQTSTPDFGFGLSDVIQTGIQSVDNLRMQAYRVYQSLPMPSKVDEAWKYIDLSKIHLDEVIKAKVSGSPKTELHMHCDEQISRSGSIQDIQEAVIHSRESVDSAYRSIQSHWQDKFNAMAMAFSNKGAFISIHGGEHLENPIRVTRIHKQKSLGIFNHIIRLERNASAIVVLDSQAADGNPISLDVENLHLLIGESAHLTLLELDAGDPGSNTIQHSTARIDNNGILDWIVCTTDGQFKKKFMRIELEGAGASAKVSGLYLANGSQHFEFDTYQDHRAPNTTSDLILKGVLLGSSRTVFRGMIHVHPEAVKTDGYQANRNLVLSNHAHADSIPGLEILADDVRCTHGATVGRVDPDELFYLKSRGLGFNDARRLIVNGFFEPILQWMGVEQERIRIQEQIDKNITVD